MFFKKYKTPIFIVSLLFIAWMMLAYNLKYGTDESFLKKIALEAVQPVQGAISTTINGIKDSWLRYVLLVGIQDENKNLKKKINELKATLISYQEGYLESQRLKKILSVTDDSYGYVVARVIGREPAALSRTIMINKGAVDGLKSGMPVMAPPGLIGRLVDVSWHTSKVLLFIDENSNVDAMVQRTRVQGIVSGAGSQGFIFKYIPKTQDVKKGDVILSSGMGGSFPKGLLIGQVNRVERQPASLFLKINIVPFVDFSKLEEILILTSQKTEIH